MSDALTPTLKLDKPTVGMSNSTWGAKVNANYDAIDAAVTADRARLSAVEPIAAQGVSDAAAAQAKANTAENDAQTGIANAAAAQGTANSAQAKANTAESDAQTGIANAAAAQGIANSASNKADAAQGTANSASSKADAAQNTANAANAAASAAQNTANDAQTKANKAISYLPPGMIMLWSGASGAIPTGWVLCDGTNGTPDLRNRFVVGAAGSYGVGATGGGQQLSLDFTSQGHVLTAAELAAHVHTLTDPGHSHSISDPGHTHPYTKVVLTSSTSGASFGSASTSTDNTGNTKTGLTVNSGGIGIPQTDNTGQNSAHTHQIQATVAAPLPPYYALCYIMRSGS